MGELMVVGGLGMWGRGFCSAIVFIIVRRGGRGGGEGLERRCGKERRALENEILKRES